MNENGLEKKSPRTERGPLRWSALDGSNQRMSQYKDPPLENQAVQPGFATGADRSVDNRLMHFARIRQEPPTCFAALARGAAGNQDRAFLLSTERSLARKRSLSHLLKTHWPEVVGVDWMDDDAMRVDAHLPLDEMGSRKVVPYRPASSFQSTPNQLASAERETGYF